MFLHFHFVISAIKLWTCKPYRMSDFKNLKFNRKLEMSLILKDLNIENESIHHLVIQNLNISISDK